MLYALAFWACLGRLERPRRCNTQVLSYPLKFLVQVSNWVPALQAVEARRNMACTFVMLLMMLSALAQCGAARRGYGDGTCMHKSLPQHNTRIPVLSERQPAGQWSLLIPDNPPAGAPVVG